MSAAGSRSLLSTRALRRGVALGVVGVFVVRLTYFLFLDLADGRAGHVAERLFNEVTGGLLAAIPLAAMAWLAHRWPLARPLRRGTLAVYLAGFVLLSAVHTTLMIAVRAALAPLLGLTGYEYAFSAARYAYEGANDVLVFVAAVALLALAESVLAERDRERRAASLERSLLRAELSNLRLQLQPHFLFNALNTISSTMYDDVDAADALLGRLSDLLRTSLRTTHTHEVPARDELAILAQYLELMRARFGDRLDVTVDAPDDVGDLLVPSMVLQPLVENAVRHGGVSRIGRGRVAVALRREGATLVLTVRDSGLGTRDSTPSRVPSPESRVPTPDGGTGLSATARRLQLLYGDDGSMRAGPTHDGWEVVIRIPARAAVPNDLRAEALA
ncbi:histidine kinase internal region [Gemmatirosa kalamazoonensis]|uniref:Histidine kinase internal region n=1 Tax=Gemmatirosa kalamazoonensis TaxID=861299 RepID=W0RH94_9BACT|nr:histidine kinase [Gemmatirosa kalamazoonensis]AHG88763.1 histidine kinase internal region [Gemmatirosa kalamazoonensis]